MITGSWKCILENPITAPQQPLLRIENISVQFGYVRVIWGVSFSVDRGQIVSLIGSNGAGKTTILRTIAGILRATSGTIVFDGTPVHQMKTEKIVDAGIICVPEGRGIFPDMTVRENLDMGAYSRHARRNHAENLTTVYSLFPILEERKGQRAGTLSGGEAQMLAIGRGLMAEPVILMLDEPTAGVAPIVVDAIFKAIVKLRDEERLTILLVEQDAGRALSICDYAYILENGRVSVAGPGKSLMENPHVRNAYLGL
jgi:branched-chain amino acid transport system ATP-binding protein